MDFETSCWSAASLANRAFYDPVQRRPKIDYFDSASITPIVSHISSNGYYGYIPTTHVPSTLIEVHAANSPQKESDDINMTDDNVTMEEPNSEQSKHQGRSMFGNRKRAVECVDDFAADYDAKRRRSHLSVIDFVDDMQTNYDDTKDMAYNASNIGNSSSLNNISSIVTSTINANKSNASDQLSNERFYERKKQVTSLWTDTNYTESTTIPMKSDSNDDAFQKTAAGNESTATNQQANDDMENLYWHTHGSLLWQH